MKAGKQVFWISMTLAIVLLATSIINNSVKEIILSMLAFTVSLITVTAKLAISIYNDYCSTECEALKDVHQTIVFKQVK